MTLAQVARGLFERGLAACGIGALHDHRPDIAGVVDAAIDPAVEQGHELDSLRHALALVDGKAAFLKAILEHLGENVLLGKWSTGDNLWRRRKKLGDRLIEAATPDDQETGGAREGQPATAA